MEQNSPRNLYRHQGDQIENEFHLENGHVGSSEENDEQFINYAHLVN